MPITERARLINEEPEGGDSDCGFTARITGSAFAGFFSGFGTCSATEAAVSKAACFSSGGAVLKLLADILPMTAGCASGIVSCLCVLGVTHACCVRKADSDHIADSESEELDDVDKTRSQFNDV